jgi:hypothetical protein
MKGGQTLKEAIKRMVTTLFTNNMCRMLNWTGGNGCRKENHNDDDCSDANTTNKKVAFKDLQCRKVLESE